MIKNISDIISLNNQFSSVVNIKGKCNNKQDFWSTRVILHQCGRCKKLVCGCCANSQKNKCVVCEMDNLGECERKCSFCNKLLICFMCYYCNIVVKKCRNYRCKLYNSRRYNYKYLGDEEIIICDECE